VITPPLKGLGGTIELVRDMVKRDPVALDMLDQVLQGKEGRPPKETVDNINGLERPTGTSEAQALRRLRHHFPDLHRRVLAGEMSAHRAAILAGFRHPTAIVRTDDARSAIATLLKHYGREELERALAE
jgi:hypothetical protein